MFWMRNKENNYPIHTLIWRPVYAQKVCLSEVPGHTCMIVFQSEAREKAQKKAQDQNQGEEGG